MRVVTGSTITAGITASVAVAAFMLVIPRIIGMAAIDITHDIGMAFNSQSPYLAGAIFLAALGVLWASLFGVFYNRIPGSSITKGAIFGIIVGLFSLSVIPNIMNSIDTVIGMSNQYPVTDLALNAQVIVMMLAYMVFGVVLSLNHRPADTTSNI